MPKPGFKIWDSSALADAEKVCLQIKEKIETLSEDSKTEIENLPHSLVPSAVLYDMAICFDAAYNMLLERDLVLTGNLKSSNKRNNIH